MSAIDSWPFGAHKQHANGVLEVLSGVSVVRDCACQSPGQLAWGGGSRVLL